MNHKSPTPAPPTDIPAPPQPSSTHLPSLTSPQLNLTPSPESHHINPSPQPPQSIPTHDQQPTLISNAHPMCTRSKAGIHKPKAFLVTMDEP